MTKEIPRMRKQKLVAAMFAGFAMITAPVITADDFKPETIIALERAAIDRWGRGDPQGFLETYAQDVSYFAPSEKHRTDGLAAMRDILLPITGKVKIDKYEM